MKWRLPPGGTGRASQGERPSFEAAVLPHLDAAYNLARWLTRDQTMAEDVVQDAMLRALSYFASFQGGDGRAWLMRIVRNVAYGAVGARGRRATEPLDGEAATQVPDHSPDPEASLSRQQDVATIEQALAALPAELRECLVLREVEDLSYKEIAQITEVPIGTVMSRLWRARQALLAGQGGRDAS